MQHEVITTRARASILDFAGLVAQADRAIESHGEVARSADRHWAEESPHPHHTVMQISLAAAELLVEHQESGPGRYERAWAIITGAEPDGFPDLHVQALGCDTSDLIQRVQHRRQWRSLALEGAELRRFGLALTLGGHAVRGRHAGVPLVRDERGDLRMIGTKLGAWIRYRHEGDAFSFQPPSGADIYAVPPTEAVWTATDLHLANLARALLALPHDNARFVATFIEACAEAEAIAREADVDFVWPHYFTSIAEVSFAPQLYDHCVSRRLALPGRLPRLAA